MDRYVATTDLFSGWAKAHDAGLLPVGVSADDIERNGWTESVEKLSVGKDTSESEAAEKARALLDKRGVAYVDPMQGGAPMLVEGKAQPQPAPSGVGTGG